MLFAKNIYSKEQQKGFPLMSRMISVSTDVFAAIWAHRREGEESEEAILRRILGCTKAGTQADIGYLDTRNNVSFPPGFRIFRTYKRKEYAAVADEGYWRRTDNGQTYSSLNQLNSSIATKNENVWGGQWKFRDARGIIKSIDSMRG